MSIDDDLEKAEQLVRELRAKKLGIPVGWAESHFDQNVAVRAVSPGTNLTANTSHGGGWRATVSLERTTCDDRSHLADLCREAEVALIASCRAIIEALEGT